MKVAIMQPTFLPWLGYFSLIESVEKFVFLDTVQFESRSWQQRNRILMNNEAKWITIPTSLPSGRSTLINKVLINTEHYSGTSIIGTISHAYRNKPGFDFVKQSLFKYFLTNPSHLSTLNIDLIKEISFAIGIKPNFISASELNVSGSKAELLLDICKTLGASTYVSPVGSKVYLDKFAGFSDSGIHLEYQTFHHPVYSQGKIDFISHLSIIDAICNLDVQATSELIHKGNKF